MKRFCCGVALASLVLLSACSGGAPGTGGQACDPVGQGTLQVAIGGLPSGVSAQVVVRGPGGFSQTLGASQTLSVGGGTYTVDVEKTASPVGSTTVVRTAYAGTSDRSQACVRNGETVQVTVTYSQIPSSGKLWTNNRPPQSSGDPLTHAYAEASLLASGTVSEAVGAGTVQSRSLTFDADGNLWVIGGTTVDPTLLRYPASALGSSGTKTPDKRLNVSGWSCLPGALHLTFDPSGNLWLSVPCAQKLVRIGRTQLAAATGTLSTVTPEVEISGFSGSPRGLAFDAFGNLWVGHDLSSTSGQVMRFDAADLSSSTTAASAARTLSASLSSSSTNTAYELAFDAAGSLWVLCSNCGGAILYKFTSGQLSGTGNAALSPDKQISLPVGALPEAFAFDEGGGLWLAYDKPASSGRFARLSPTQLTSSSTPGSPTVPARIVEGSNLGYAKTIAFYPAPAGLPLFHRLP
ncbi:Two component regulator propeller [Meiothermus luteus]|uniref:Two component regulator propeller n=1 Tax=Meiothermus luteus TaxID=2026184 RepID=A0A399EP23_9DEIN|nr:Two component regulator propeller [Meiothermus luteus]